MPSLYSADLSTIGEPVKKEKKIRAKKSTQQSDVPVPEEKPKRVLSDKQKEALKKGQEARKLKLQQSSQASQPETTVQEVPKKKRAPRAKVDAPVTPPPTPVIVPAAPKKKRTKSQETMNTDQRIDFEVEQVTKTPTKKGKRKVAADGIPEELDIGVKNKKVKRDETEPPKWFKQYVSSVKKEESSLSKDKKPKKMIAEEAEVQASEQWKNGMVRDRVRNEVDGHMNRMYSMIFGARKMH
jgi:hypothetical protein